MPDGWDSIPNAPQNTKAPSWDDIPPASSKSLDSIYIPATVPKINIESDTPKITAPKTPSFYDLTVKALGDKWDQFKGTKIGKSLTDPIVHAPVVGDVSPLDMLVAGPLIGGVGYGASKLFKGAEEAAPEVEQGVKRLAEDIPKVTDPEDILKGTSEIAPKTNPLKPKLKLNKDGTFTNLDTGAILDSKGNDVSAYPEGLRTSKGKVKVTFSRVGEDATTPTLPKDLQGAKPRYNIQGSSYSPKFENDLDKAAYIIAQINPSKRDSDYLKFVMDNTGLDEQGARSLGKQVKEHVKQSIKDHIKSGGAEGDFTVPSFSSVKNEVPNQVTAPPVNINSGEMPNVKSPEELKSSSGGNGNNPPPPTDNKDFSWQDWWNNRSRKDKALDIGADASRSIQVGFDLGWPLRQGRKLIGSHPNIWAAASKSGAKAFANEEYFNTALKEIENHPKFKDAIESGVDFTTLGSKVEEREEQFRSPLAENLGELPKIKDVPVIGKGLKLVSSGVRASERASTLAGDVARFNTWMDITKDSNVDKKAAAELVNTLTGRSKLPGKSLQQASPALNYALYSPRLIYSNFKVLNPYTYFKAPKGVRAEYVKSALGMIGTTFAVNEAAEAAGAKITWNPTSSDFGKIRIGNTRLDTGGGIFQNLVLLARLGINPDTLKNFASGNFKVAQETTNANGKTTALGSGFGKDTAFDVIANYGRSKASPLAGAIINSIDGQDMVGNPTNPLKEVGKMYTPFLAQDFIDAAKDNPELAPFISAVSAMGANSQTYQPRPSKSGNKMRIKGIPRIKF